jgi:hypothetical protein
MKATRRDVEAAQRRTAEAEAATSAARKELADWRAKAYALQTKVGAGGTAGVLYCSLYGTSFCT